MLLKDALMPNLVQTLENNPALIHGGPFANIAHGCNSVVATWAGLKLADYVVTEAGFGTDLGAEKFFDIKCRKAGLRPDAAVVVATIRALKMHGGVALGDLRTENVEAVRAGLANLGRHLDNIGRFGVPAVVGINRFTADTDAELDAVREYCEGRGRGAVAIECTHWADGSAGAEALARKVVEVVESGAADFRPLYPDDMGLWEKIGTIARDVYGAAEVTAPATVRSQLAKFEDDGFGRYPVCMAKTQYSFSTDPGLKGAPSGHSIPVREVRLSSGAEFLVAICGDMMTMPGLPRVPAANSIPPQRGGRGRGPVLTTGGGAGRSPPRPAGVVTLSPSPWPSPPPPSRDGGFETGPCPNAIALDHVGRRSRGRESGLHSGAQRHGPGMETRDAHRRRLGGGGSSAADPSAAACRGGARGGERPDTGPRGAGPSRLPADPPEAPRPRHLGRALRVLGRRHRDRVGDARPHRHPPRTPFAAPRGVLHPHRRRARRAHRILRLHGPGIARRARRAPPDPPGRPVRVRVSGARPDPRDRGDRGRDARSSGRGAGGRPYDGRAALEVGDVRVVGFSGGVGGGPGTLVAEPRARSCAGVDDSCAGGGPIPGIAGEHRVSRLAGACDPRSAERGRDDGLDAREACAGGAGAGGTGTAPARTTTTSCAPSGTRAGREGREQGRIEGQAESRGKLVRQMLVSRGISVSEGFPAGVPHFAEAPEAALVQAALACDGEQDFRARIRRVHPTAVDRQGKSGENGSDPR